MISKVLAALGDAVGAWQTALWFVTPNGWLASEKPVDLLDREPSALLDAAADVAEPGRSLVAEKTATPRRPAHYDSDRQTRCSISAKPCRSTRAT